MTLMPQTGPLVAPASARSSVYRPDELILRPDYLQVRLGRYDLSLELTPTRRGGALRLRFPANTAARVLFQIDDDGPVTVRLEAGLLLFATAVNSGGVAPNFACHFAVRLSCPLLGWQHIPVGNSTVIAVELDLAAGQVVELQVAHSFIDADCALRKLARELAGVAFADVRVAAQTAWHNLLSRVQIAGATPEQYATFYTCLYRSLLFPRALDEPDETGQPVHRSPYDGAVHQGVLSADNGFWDTYRTVYPLLALIAPEQLGSLLEGWVQVYRESGWLPTWASPGHRACMVGTHSDAVFADAYVRGVRGFDAETALAAMLKHAAVPGEPGGRYGRVGLEAYHALGYVPADVADQAVSRSLDYAYNDFCIAQLARALGQGEAAAALEQRALRYPVLYDHTSGFFRARMSNGAWLEPFDPIAWDGRAYVEGSAWQHTWAVPHDPAGLIRLMGGAQRFVQRLDTMLAMPPRFTVGTYPREIHEMTEFASAQFGQYAHANQPVHHVLYLYISAGQPWKTQFWVRRVLNELYSASPDGLPGNEDNGEMSAWYVLSALGLFPLCPGRPIFALGSPLFPHAELTLQGGARVTIAAPGNRSHTPFVQARCWNGAPWSAHWIDHGMLASGGLLECTMSATAPEHEGN